MSQCILMIFTFLYGIVIGSFLNVCIFRIPRKESIVTTGSHCMSCGKKIAWYDLIPLFSFLFLRGKCRNCKTRLSLQYPAVEALNGVLYVIIFSVNGFNLDSVCYALLTSALIVLSVIDYRTMEIPLSINIVILAIGVLHCGIDMKNIVDYVIGFFAASLFLLICFLITRGRGIGGGDIKLMAVAGLCIGWQNILLALVAGCFVGSVVQITKMIVTKKGRVFAFGPYLSVGIWLAMLWGKTFVQWYLQLITNR